MDIRNIREIKQAARQRLGNAQAEKKIVLIYTGLVLGLSVLTVVVSYVLGLQISNFSGLGNLGTRSFLSTVQTILPLVQSALVMCLDLGYVAAMLRISRGQYASPNTLRLGFDRFWPLLRMTLLQSLLYIGLGIAAAYLATMIFLITPLSADTVEILMPLVSDTSVLNGAIQLDDAAYYQLISSMLPALGIFVVIYCALCAPISYQYRMANYVLIDRPGIGAMAALRESRNMMRGNRRHLFKLDLSLWWYHLSIAVAGLVCNADYWLPMAGVTLPWSEEVSYFGFYAIYLVLEFAIYYFLRNRAEVTFATAYEAVKPEEKKDSGVVLGNIFQM